MRRARAARRGSCAGHGEKGRAFGAASVAFVFRSRDGSGRRDSVVGAGVKHCAPVRVGGGGHTCARGMRAGARGRSGTGRGHSACEHTHARRRAGAMHARTHETHAGRRRTRPGGAEQHGQRLVSRSRQARLHTCSGHRVPRALSQSRCPPPGRGTKAPAKSPDTMRACLPAAPSPTRFRVHRTRCPCRVATRCIRCARARTAGAATAAAQRTSPLGIRPRPRTSRDPSSKGTHPLPAARRRRPPFHPFFFGPRDAFEAAKKKMRFAAKGKNPGPF